MKTPPLTRVTILALLAVVSGCALFFPRTTALKSVHDTYRQEFVQWAVPTPGLEPAPTNNQPQFGTTLQAIRNFRVNYGTNSAESAHLTVLEGMIYLQTGRIGMARLLAPDIRAQISLLRSGTGSDVRDELFAENFDNLVKGWSEINAKFDNDPSTFTKWTNLQEAASAINQNLTGKLQAKQLASADADGGAIYLATTAAIFYDWAFVTEKIQDEAGAKTNKPAWFSESRDLIGKFLSDTEKKAAADTNANAMANSPGRIRYLEWYGWLGRELK